MAWPRIPPADRRVWCGADRVVGWSFVENCTVDASIFVVKLSRANGGCLGTRSRGRTWEAAIGLGELSTKL
jgi:hypothetical protein